MPAKGSTPSSRNASPTGAGARRHAPADMPTAQSRPRGVALDAAVADSGALRAALGETGSWRAQAEALARPLVEGTRASGAPLFDVQRAFAIFPPGSPAGESLFRLAEALPRIPDRPSRAAMLADRVPALRGWKAAAALPFAGLATNAIGRQFVYAETIATALRRAERDACALPATRFSFDMLGEGARTDADANRNFRRTMDAIRAMGRALRARRNLARTPRSFREAVLHSPSLRRSELRAGSRRVARSPEANLRPGRCGGYRAPARRRGVGKVVASARSVRGAGGRPGTGPLGRAGPCGAGLSAARAGNRGRIVGDRSPPPQARRHADRRAAGEGRLLGRRGQAGAGAGPRALSGIHRQGAHRPVLSRLRPTSLLRAGQRLSAVRHAYPRDARVRARACRPVPRRPRSG